MYHWIIDGYKSGLEWIIQGKWLHTCGLWQFILMDRFLENTLKYSIGNVDIISLTDVQFPNTFNQK